MPHFLLDYAVSHTLDFLLEIPVPRTEEEKKQRMHGKERKTNATTHSTTQGTTHDSTSTKEINECIFCVKVIKSSTSKVDCNSEDGVSQKKKTELLRFYYFLV